MMEFINESKSRMAIVFDHESWGYFTTAFRAYSEGSYKTTRKDYVTKEEAIDAAKKFIEES